MAVINTINKECFWDLGNFNKDKYYIMYHCSQLY